MGSEDLLHVEVKKAERSEYQRDFLKTYLKKDVKKYQEVFKESDVEV